MTNYCDRATILRKTLNLLVILYSLFLIYACSNKEAKNSSYLQEEQSSADTAIALLPDLVVRYGTYAVSYKALSENQYLCAKNKYYNQPDTLLKITDAAQALSRLKDVVFLTDSADIDALKKDETYAYFDNLCFFKEIHFRNGNIEYLYNEDEETHCRSYNFELEFSSYYPTLDVLLLIGSHNALYAYNLTTGEGVELVGDPEMSYTSDDEKYKLMGYDNGQASLYYMQVRDGSTYSNLYSLNDDFYASRAIEFVEEAFWDNNHNLYCIFSAWNSHSQDSYKVYYKITIQE